jgi:hypothetical protein
VEVGRNPAFQVPAASYQSLGELTVWTWRPAAAPDHNYPPDTREILDRYLEFARFPLLRRVQRQGGLEVLEWLDLRFSVPGRALPFVLRLQVDGEGRLQSWLLGPGGGGTRQDDDRD